MSVVHSSLFVSSTPTTTPVQSITETYLNSHYFKPDRDKWNLQIAQDIGQVALLHACKLIATIQSWQAEIKGDVKLVLATGKTQLMSIAEASRIIKDWKNLGAEDRKLLEACGAKLNCESAIDNQRIKIFHLDTILPQKRSAEHSYAYQVSRFAEHLGIPKHKCFLFYGDVKLPNKEDDTQYGTNWFNPECNQLTEQEYERLHQSVQAEGLLIEDFRQGRLAKDHIQYSFLDDVTRYGSEYSKLLASDGGPHILNFSVGSSYEGAGHIGFTEAEHTKLHPLFWLQVPSFLDYASFPALAGNIKSDYGMHRAYNEEGKQIVGVYTLSTEDFRTNPNVTVILNINTSGKASTVLSFCEQNPQPNFPVTALSDIGSNDLARKSLLIVDPTAFSKTTLALAPWLFSKDLPFEKKDFPRFFLAMLELYNSKKTLAPATLDQLTESMVKSLELTSENNLDGYIAIVKNTSSWQEEIDQINRNLQNVSSWSKAINNMGLISEPKQLVLHVSPHFDDVTLALGNGIDAFTKSGVLQRVMTMTPGDSAVSNEYLINVLDATGYFEEADWNEVVSTVGDFTTKEETFLTELVKLLKQDETPVNSNPNDYNFWAKLSEKEKFLRAKLLILQLNKTESWKDQFINQDRVSALREFISEYSQHMTSWSGQKVPKIVRELKSAIRLTEDRTAYMSRGVLYGGTTRALEPGWYTGGAEREKTLTEADIHLVKNDLTFLKPNLIVLNGEGFMDHEAHCLTEMTLRLAIEELLNDGQMLNTKILLYRGVWDRTAISGQANQILIPYSQNGLLDLDRGFKVNYRSQVPALVPDGGCPGQFFSGRVLENAKTTLNEYKRLVQKDKWSEKISQAEGLLAFDIIDLSDPQQREEFLAQTKLLHDELERVAPAIERGSFSKVVAGSSVAKLPNDVRQRLEKSFSSVGLALNLIY